LSKHLGTYYVIKDEKSAMVECLSITFQRRRLAYVEG